jgi:hypothetical protein
MRVTTNIRTAPSGVLITPTIPPVADPPFPIFWITPTLLKPPPVKPGRTSGPTKADGKPGGRQQVQV